MLYLGGKREWVYTNIRVKPESAAEFNRAIEGKGKVLDYII